MMNSLKIVDDFYPFPEELRACALALPEAEVIHDGHSYQGWRRYEHEGFKSVMSNRLANVMGYGVEIVAQSFVVATRGFKTTQWIHADLGLGQYAAVLHLHDHKSGTAFWRHRATGRDAFSQEMAAEMGGPEKTSARLIKEGSSQKAWDMVSLAGSKFNRLVIYPSALFHSRWPKTAFGETAGEARITWVAFFNAGGFQ